MSNKQTLWVISELFYPEETSTGYIMTEIANAMTSKYDVKVICGPEVYDAKKKRDETSKQKLDPSIELIRVKGIVENKKSSLSRAKKFILISRRLFKVAKKNIKDGDVVFMVSNPFPLILSMSKLRMHRNIRLVMLVHDVFPEGILLKFHIKGFFAKKLMNKFNHAYAKADTLVSLGRDMCDLLERKTGGKTEIVQIENWADIESIHPIERQKEEKMVLQYAGNIGSAQGIQEVIQFIQEAANPLLRFDIWGTGEMEENLKRYVNEEGLQEAVSFKGPYFRSQQEQVLNACDIALVSLNKNMYGRGVPSKTYNILGAGKPVLYIGPAKTEIGMMVEEEGVGFSFTNEEKNRIVGFLKTLTPEMLSGMGTKARLIAEQKYSEPIILDKFRKVL